MIKYQASGLAESLHDSLSAAVSQLALDCGYDPIACVTASADDVADMWLVYASQDALDADLARGALSRKSRGWFGVVEVVEVAS